MPYRPVLASRPSLRAMIAVAFRTVSWTEIEPVLVQRQGLRDRLERKKRFAGVALVLVAIVLLISSTVRPRSPRSASAEDHAAVLVGAGDVADCRDLSGAEATARLLEQIPERVLVGVELAYPDG